MGFRSGFVTRYLNPLEVEAEIATIVQTFPSLCRLETLPYLSHGYQGSRVEARGRHPMHVLRITAPGATRPKPAVLLMRSHHAREWINALAIVETVRQLVENYRLDDSDFLVRQVVATLERVEFLIVPESNPDGARLSFFDSGQQMWRKNLRPPEIAGCLGVDCNRNYPRYFGEAGSSDRSCTEIYRGPVALSEPETANIAHLLMQERTIVFAIDSHSHGQAIFRPTASGGTYVTSLPVPPEDEALYRHLEDAMNRGIRRVQGIQYSTGSTSNHAGTTDEYFYFDHHIYGFDLECGEDFQPPVAGAKLAALEVAESTRALGWCATGETGLDIVDLLHRRETLDYALTTRPAVTTLPEPWKVEALPPYEWRRFRVRFRPKKLHRIVYEGQDLLEQGFDLDYAPMSQYLEVIVSAVELEQLLRLGYHPEVQADLIGSTSDVD